MGKAITKLYDLRAQRERMTSENKRLSAYQGGQFAGWSAALDAEHRKARLAALDREIETAEADALKEKERETAEAVLSDIGKAGTRAGREFTEALQNALNGKR